MVRLNGRDEDGPRNTATCDSSVRGASWRTWRWPFGRWPLWHDGSSARSRLMPAEWSESSRPLPTSRTQGMKYPTTAIWAASRAKPDGHSFGPGRSCSPGDRPALDLLWSTSERSKGEMADEAAPAVGIVSSAVQTFALELVSHGVGRQGIYALRERRVRNDFVAAEM